MLWMPLLMRLTEAFASVSSFVLSSKSLCSVIHVSLVCTWVSASYFNLWFDCNIMLHLKIHDSLSILFYLILYPFLLMLINGVTSTHVVDSVCSRGVRSCVAASPQCLKIYKKLTIIILWSSYSGHNTFPLRPLLTFLLIHVTVDRQVTDVRICKIH